MILFFTVFEEMLVQLLFPFLVLKEVGKVLKSLLGCFGISESCTFLPLLKDISNFVSSNCDCWLIWDNQTRKLLIHRFLLLNGILFVATKANVCDVII
jgi:hypothetical protein